MAIHPWLHDADTAYEGDFVERDGLRTRRNPEDIGYRFRGGFAPEVANRSAGTPGQYGGIEALRIGEEILDPTTIRPTGGEDVYGRQLASARTKAGEDYVAEMVRRGAMTSPESDYALASFMRQGTYLNDPNDPMRQVAEQVPYNESPNVPVEKPWMRRGLAGTAYTSLLRGADQAEGMIGEFASGALKHIAPETSRDLANWTDKQDYERQMNPAEIGDSRNIHGASDLAKYVIEAGMENVPQMLPAAAALPLGGLPAAAVYGATGIAFNTGDAYGELKDRGVDDFGEALKAGVPMAALDLAGSVPLAGAVLRSFPKRQLTKSITGHIAAGAAKSFASEAPTEWLQEEILMDRINRNDPSFDPMSPENRHRAFESFVKGGLAGAGVGTVGAATTINLPEDSNFGMGSPVQSAMAAGLSDIYHTQGVQAPSFVFDNDAKPGFNQETGVVTMPEIAPDADERSRVKAMVDPIAVEIGQMLPPGVWNALQQNEATIADQIAEGFLRAAYSGEQAPIWAHILKVAEEVIYQGGFTPIDITQPATTAEVPPMSPDEVNDFMSSLGMNAEQTSTPVVDPAPAPVVDSAFTQVDNSAPETTWFQFPEQEQADLFGGAGSLIPEQEATTEKRTFPEGMQTSLWDAMNQIDAEERDAAAFPKKVEAWTSKQDDWDVTLNNVDFDTPDKAAAYFTEDKMRTIPRSGLEDAIELMKGTPGFRPIKRMIETHLAQRDKVTAERAKEAEAARTTQPKTPKEKVELSPMDRQIMQLDRQTIRMMPDEAKADLLDYVNGKAHFSHIADWVNGRNTPAPVDFADAFEQAETDVDFGQEQDEVDDDDADNQAVIGNEERIGDVQGEVELQPTARDVYHGDKTAGDSPEEVIAFRSREEAEDRLLDMRINQQKKTPDMRDEFQDKVTGKGPKDELANLSVVPVTRMVTLTPEQATRAKSRGNEVEDLGDGSYKITHYVIKESVENPVNKELAALENREFIIQRAGQEFKSPRVWMNNPKGDLVAMDTTRIARIGKANAGAEFEESDVKTLARDYLSAVSTLLEAGYTFPKESAIDPETGRDVIKGALDEKARIYSGGEQRILGDVLSTNSKDSKSTAAERSDLEQRKAMLEEALSMEISFPEVREGIESQLKRVTQRMEQLDEDQLADLTEEERALAEELDSTEAEREAARKYYKDSRQWERYEKGELKTIPDHTLDGNLISYRKYIAALEGKTDPKSVAKLKWLKSPDGLASFAESWRKSLDTYKAEYENTNYDPSNILQSYLSELDSALGTAPNTDAIDEQSREQVEAELDRDYKTELHNFTQILQDKWQEAYDRLSTNKKGMITHPSDQEVDAEVKAVMAREGITAPVKYTQQDVDTKFAARSKEVERSKANTKLAQSRYENNQAPQSLLNKWREKLIKAEKVQVLKAVNIIKGRDMGTQKNGVPYHKALVSEVPEAQEAMDRLAKGQLLSISEIEALRDAIANRINELDKPRSEKQKRRAELNRRIADISTKSVGSAESNLDSKGFESTMEAKEAKGEYELSHDSEGVLDQLDDPVRELREVGKRERAEVIDDLSTAVSNPNTPAHLRGKLVESIGIESRRLKERRYKGAKVSNPINRNVAQNVVRDFKKRFPKLDISFSKLDSAGLYSDGKVQIDLSRISSVEQLERILRHEAIGHYGVRSVMGEADFKSLLDDIINTTDKDLKAIWDEVKETYADADVYEQAEEVIARAAENPTKSNAIKDFLTKVARMLRKAFGMKTPMSMSELQSILRNVESKMEQGKEGKDFGSVNRASFNTAEKVAKKAGNTKYGKKLDDTFRELGKSHFGRVVQNMNQQARQRGEYGKWVAGNFFHTVGDTVYSHIHKQSELMRVHMMGFASPKLNALIKDLPKTPLTKVLSKSERKKVDAENRRIAKLLIDRVATNDPTVVAIRKYLTEINGYLKKELNFPVSSDPNFFPTVMDRIKLESGYSDAVDKLAKALTAEQQKQGLKNPISASQITSIAHEMVTSMLGGNHSVHTGGLQGIYANHFGFKANATGQVSNVLENQWVRDALADYISQDVGYTLYEYTHSAFRRAIQEQSFSRTVDGKTDPMGEVIKRMQDAVASGDITHEDEKWFREVYFPSQMGTLGLGMSPKLHNAQSWAITYMNSVLLPLSPFANLVDFAGIAIRANDARAPFRSVLNYAKSKQRKIDTDIAEMIGAIEEGIIDHMANESMIGSPDFTANKVNEVFFKYNGMYHLTRAMRVMSISAARHSIGKWAEAVRKTGDKAAKAQLDELNLTVEEALDLAKNPPTTLNQKIALNRYINGAIPRPDASTKPGWGNDHRKKLLWYLKSFLWAQHEVILKRIYNNMKNEKPITTMVPLIVAGVFMMGLASAGYDLRNWISGGQTKQGKAYWWEVLNRSGLMGQLPLVVDSNDSIKHGQLALTGMIGPAASMVQNVVSQPPHKAIPKALPIIGGISGARKAVESNLEWLK